MRCGKKISFCLLLSFWATQLYAITLSPPMQKALDACIALRNAAGIGSEVALEAAIKDFVEAGIRECTYLDFVEGNKVSLNGHFVFSRRFVEDLLHGRNVYRFAQQQYGEENRHIAYGTENILCQTIAIAEKSSAIYRMATKGKIEFAAISEAKGLVTLRIHDVTNNRWYNDSVDEKNGRLERTLQIDLPTESNTILEIEVINTSKRSISVACLYGYED